MGLKKIVNLNRIYRSQGPNLIKLENMSPWDSPNQI